MQNKQIAISYRQKYGWEMPTLKLARIMYRDNVTSFSTLNAARLALTKLEGKMGNKKPIKELPERVKNPYSFPDSDESTLEPFLLNSKRLLVLSDIHIPYHSITALTSAFKYAKQEKPDAILLNGDVLDFFGLSRFVKTPNSRNFSQELAAFKRFFEVLNQVFGAKTYYKLGNHEERYNHFLWTKAAELDGVEEFNLESIIKARAEGIDVIGGKRVIKAGGLNIFHGHELVGSTPGVADIAKRLMAKVKTSAIQGHNHQTTKYVEKDIDGNVKYSYSTGCLCELYPPYMPYNNWNWGFAIIDIDGLGFDVRNATIDNKGKVIF